jgi:hypothetical protein
VSTDKQGRSGLGLQVRRQAGGFVRRAQSRQYKEVQMTSQEASRVEELLDEASLAKDSIQEAIRRITSEMPHLTDRDIAQVAQVHAEVKRMEAAEHAAAAKAARQIAEIIRETERISGTAGLTTEAALQILADRAAQGDKRPANLLDRFSQAALVVGLDSD